jgi:LacI family transcriptional regulator
MSPQQPLKRRPSMADVAREAGVSLSTVDRVLNLRAGVRTDTAQAIAEAASRLGFRARSVIEQRLLQERPTVRLGFLLQMSGEAFYQSLAQALSQAAAAHGQARIRIMIGYLNELEPQAVAQRILDLGSEVDALAVVAADHPLVRDAVARLRQRGLPVVALVSALASPTGAGYVGVDNRRMGRTAGWFACQLALRPGPVAVMLSSQRFQCQELCELSFLSYLTEQSADWELLASRLTFEDEDFAYSNTLDLLTGQPDLAALYVAGGGIKGVLRALAEQRQRGSPLPVVICHDLTDFTRTALRDGRLQAVLSHPVQALAQQAVQILVQAIGADQGSEMPSSTVPILIEVAESV